MRKIMTQTEINNKKLLNAPSFEKADLEGMVTENLAEALTDLFQKKKTNASRISGITGISRSYVSELQGFKRGHKKPGRNVLISICIAAKGNLEETNHVLKCARMKELYSRDEADAIIIWALSHGKDYYEILELLSTNGYDNYLRGE